MQAPRLGYVQSVSAGMNQYDVARFKALGVRLASAQGVNARAVAEHAIALILSLTRQLHLARDNQHKKHWRGMIGDPAQREDELQGKTLLVVGLGRHRRPSGATRQGLRHEGDRHSAAIRPGARNGADEVHGRQRLAVGAAARRFRRADLSDHARRPRT